MIKAMAEWYKNAGVTDLCIEQQLEHSVPKESTQPSIRPLPKLASGSQALGDLGAEERNLGDIEDPSTNQAMQLAADVEFREGSIIEHRFDTLEQLYQEVCNYDGCALKHTAGKTVFARGNPKASVMLIGEAPGANEDAQGIPFCGQSGKLLDNILKAIDLNENNCYITNAVFWRPPGNRRPTQEELDLCRPFAARHIALVQPKLLIMVGSTAVESLLGITDSMATIRQREFLYSNQYLNGQIPSVAIFHPSYLLRQSVKKRDMWEDICWIRQKYNI